MLPFHEEQLILYAKMKEKACHPFFLHKYREGIYLWVSDIPRRNPTWDFNTIEGDDYLFALCGDLCYIGFSPRKWKRIEDSLTCEAIVFPSQKERLEIYELARLLLSHTESEPSYEIACDCYRLTDTPMGERTICLNRIFKKAVLALRAGKLHDRCGGLILYEHFLKEILP